jgi:murein DD-endopeptidase MepM/ murein hydrolase activator NlpD
MRARPSLLIAIAAGTLVLLPLGVAAAAADAGHAEPTASPVTSLVSRTRPYPAYLAIDLRGIEELLPTTTTVAPPAPKPSPKPAAKPATVVRPAATAVVKAASVAPTTDFIWPVHGPVISPYGGRDGRRHEGVDIGSPVGTPVLTPLAGKVSFVGTMSGYGLVIDVDHGNGLTTRYAHLSRQDVRVGQAVSQGDVLGAVGMTGRTTAPHLHFETRVGGVPRNPVDYLP